MCCNYLSNVLMLSNIKGVSIYPMWNYRTCSAGGVSKLRSQRRTFKQAQKA